MQAVGNRQQATVGQGSLLDIFEQQFAASFAASDPIIENPQSKIQNGENPFRKQWGSCVIPHEGRADERVYWCHKCGKKFCWTCFEQHSD